MDPTKSPLLTDHYQLTMLKAYLDHGMVDTAVFEFFVRKRPAARNFMIAAGLEQAVEFLQGLCFEAAELEWLAAQPGFDATFIDYLAELRFRGDVQAMPEGTIFFPDEPILRVCAPLPVAQLVESRLINLLHFQTLIASKAVRSVLAAPDKMLVDFGLRRAHGAEAGLLAARATYLAGFTGSATVLAATRFGIPVFGTMAHSFVEAHDREDASFEHFAHSHPDNVVLLIDTYDTEAAAVKVVALAPRLRAAGISIKAVRIDSGDLGAHAHRVRKILDAGGCQQIGIFASGGLDEYALHALLAEHAPIDGFGIGTQLDTSSDAPFLDCAYKLQEYAGLARRKRSEGKRTWPGRKQVYRQYGKDSRMSQDILSLESDPQPGEPLLVPIMRAGERLAAPTGLDAIRTRVAEQLSRLPDSYAQLEAATDHRVEIASALHRLAKDVDNRLI